MLEIAPMIAQPIKFVVVEVDVVVGIGVVGIVALVFVLVLVIVVVIVILFFLFLPLLHLLLPFACTFTNPDLQRAGSMIFLIFRFILERMITAYLSRRSKFLY